MTPSISLTQLSETLKSNDGYFAVTWKNLRNGRYGSFSNSCSPSIVLDGVDYTPFYCSNVYNNDDDSRYLMMSLSIESEDAWNKLVELEAYITKQAKLKNKDLKNKTLKSFCYTNASGQHYLSLRVYKPISFKVPTVLNGLRDEDREEGKTGTPLSVDEIVPRLRRNNVRAKVVVRPDGVWNYGNNNGIALFAEVILLDPTEMEDTRLSDALNMLVG